ncbi:hypothetical protein GCM10027275_51260 [Rhabdobacter roseus]|uniref:Uncharacterized protein n=1 Tax=Rhabdobacter roseus TaxID=1655419 RepID=A0A840U538_9BACT|nr:hypothetical protein [Rhabdobacter roseus]MBB5287200.1 hypothetical protein [Rhabdobacter roseus]
MDNESIVKKWFLWVTSVLTGLVVIYLLLHFFIPGAEIIKLSKQETTDVNLILFGESNSFRTPTDTTKALGGEKTKREAMTDEEIDRIRKATVYTYIFSVRKPLCKADSVNFTTYFNQFNRTQFSVVIPNYPIRVKSYFWLTEGNRKQELYNCNLVEGSVYLEIIFWTWFGLIASLLYSVSEALKTELFDLKELNTHIAKFFYAPLCSLIIYFSINKLVSQGDIELAEFSKGTIILAFILGFFSGRAIELLTRIKDLILPLNSTSDKGKVLTPPSLQPAPTEDAEVVADEATPENKQTEG